MMDRTNWRDIKTHRLNQIKSIWKILIVPLTLFTTAAILITLKDGTSISKCSENQTAFNGICNENQITCNIENGSWIKKREWNTYSECLTIACNENYEIIENTCISKIRSRQIILTWWFIANNNVIGAYPKFKINSPILSGTIRITIDFADSYKNWGRYDNYIYWRTIDWQPARSVFWFFLVVWRETIAHKNSYLDSFWWFFDVYANNNGWDLRNSDNLWLNGLVEGKDILWWYTWTIPITNEVIVATKKWERTESYKYKPLKLLDYINNSIWNIIHLWWFLSDAWIPWWQLTYIKSIEINYIWDKNAIELINY